MSFLQCASSDQEVRDMADMLLESFSFLYADLDASDPKKAFRSNFMLQLLDSAHLQYVNGAMQNVVAICPPLHSYCGIIGLCGAAVRLVNTLRPSQTFIAYMIKLERAISMASEGHITLKMIKAVEGKVGVPKTPIKLNEHSGKESHFAFAFSDQNWGPSTRKLTERVKKRTAGQIVAIVEAAENTPLTLAARREVASSATVTTEDNPYNDICKFICSEGKLLIINLSLL